MTRTGQAAACARTHASPCSTSSGLRANGTDVTIRSPPGFRMSHLQRVARAAQSFAWERTQAIESSASSRFSKFLTPWAIVIPSARMSRHPQRVDGPCLPPHSRRSKWPGSSAVITHRFVSSWASSRPISPEAGSRTNRRRRDEALRPLPSPVIMLAGCKPSAEGPDWVKPDRRAIVPLVLYLLKRGPVAAWRPDWAFTAHEHVRDQPVACR